MHTPQVMICTLQRLADETEAGTSKAGPQLPMGLITTAYKVRSAVMPMHLLLLAGGS
jgi:hypothetical protein